MNIIQQPLYKMLAVDDEIIFVVEDTNIVANKVKVKYVAEVYVSSQAGNPFWLGHPSTSKVATLKVVPNNAGTGIFDFSRILEAYVSPDYLGGYTITASNVDYFTQYNQVDFSETTPHSIHQIDKWSTNRNAVRLVGFKFYMEFADDFSSPLQNTSSSFLNSDNFYIHNATRQEDDTLAIDSTTGNFGYNYHFNNYVLNGATANGKFLSNAPTTQYIGENDFCTLGLFAQSDSGTTALSAGGRLGYFVGLVSTITRIRQINIQFYYNGSTTGSAITYPYDHANGSVTFATTNPKAQLQYVGVGTANIQGAGGSIPANWDYYTVEAQADNGSGSYITVGSTYKFYKQEVCKGYEKFRLCWLNRLGVWDYYNFTKRNVRKVNSKKETYQQLKGTWNERKYKKYGHQGGSKTFVANAKEMITLQTDFITEEESQWLEELFTSPDVFVLQERSTDTSSGTIKNLVNKYVQPCVVTTSSYTRKTTANDKLKQYTIEIEMSHNKRIQKA